MSTTTNAHVPAPSTMPIVYLTATVPLDGGGWTTIATETDAAVVHRTMDRVRDLMTATPEAIRVADVSRVLGMALASVRRRDVRRHPGAFCTWSIVDAIVSGSYDRRTRNTECVAMEIVAALILAPRGAASRSVGRGADVIDAWQSEARHGETLAVLRRAADALWIVGRLLRGGVDAAEAKPA